MAVTSPPSSPSTPSSMTGAEGPRSFSPSRISAPPSRSRRQSRTSAHLLTRLDLPLLGITAVLAAVGLLAIASTTGAATGDTSYIFRQGAFLGAGSLILMMVASIDYRQLRSWMPILLGLTFAALLGVLQFGYTVKGTKGWFRIGSISIQPAEFAKLAVIVGLAAALTRRPSRRKDHDEDASDDPTRVALALSLLGVIALLVLAERETGSVFVYCFIGLGVLFVAGAQARLLLLIVASGIMAFTLAFSTGVLQDYQKERLTSFLDADADPQGIGYNQRQSVTAIGSGGVVGQGLFDGPQTQFGFLPEKQTDFIFAAVGEETGFAGALVVLGLEAALLWRIVTVARRSVDRFGVLLCAGVFTMILVQVIQNTGMTVRLLPITGIPLPFVSYGGSSLITSLMAVGLVQSVAAHTTPEAHLA